MEEAAMTARRRSGDHPAGRIARVNDRPRPGPRRAGERASVRPKLPERSAADDDWMKPLDDDDLRALEAAWGFVE
jgi:hypothetical protein